MTCEEVKRTLDLYLDGELGATERSAIEEHLSECEDCRAFASRQYRLKQDVKNAFVEIQAPFRLKLAVQEGIARQARQGMLHLAIGLAAAFTIVAVMLWLLLQPAVLKPTAPQIVQTRTPDEVHQFRPPSSPDAGPRPMLRPAPPAYAPVNYTP